MNLLKKIKLWLTNDWKIIETMVSRWQMGQGSLYKDFGEVVSYTILYSKSRNKYKLKCSGHKPKFHPLYSQAIKRLLEYESDTTTTDNS